jgi:hypothetical protein
MQQVESTRKIDSLVQRALAGGGVTAKPSRDGGTQSQTARRRAASALRTIRARSWRLAQVIQLMRLDHADAHLYRDGCDVLVRTRSTLPGGRDCGRAGANHGLVGQGDYHCALMELRAISQPEWHMLSAPMKSDARPDGGRRAGCRPDVSCARVARADDSTSPQLAIASERGMLVGVGVVIGLPGTGDSAIDANAIDSSIVGVLKRAGLEPWRDQIKPGRIAVVMLSAELPVGARDGTQIAVSVSAIGDARSIAGGTLLVTPPARRRWNRSCHRPGVDRRRRRANRIRHGRRCRRRHADRRACAGCGHQAPGRRPRLCRVDTIVGMIGCKGISDWRDAVLSVFQCVISACSRCIVGLTSH